MRNTTLMPGRHIATVVLLAVFLSGAIYVKAQAITITSPNKKITVKVQQGANSPSWEVWYSGMRVIQPSSLGLVVAANRFSGTLQLAGASGNTSVSDHYELFTGKKSRVSYTANKRTIHLIDQSGKQLQVIFQVSNDGVAFRYYAPEPSNDTLTVTDELTTFNFDTTARGFLQPMQIAKTGFESTNPAYEDNYHQNIAAGTFANAGWAYPALFQQADTWLLLTEAGLDGSWCASRLSCEKGSPVYKVSFPDPKETMMPNGIAPRVVGSFYSPWRIVTIGSLATIIESTLGTDVAPASIQLDQRFIRPGKASWSWIMSKDDSIVYSEQKRYIDFAADMHWQYCLVDANWDKNIGYDRIRELAGYANSKKVGLLLWYNSAGNWNTVKMTPKDKLLMHEGRTKEFALLKEMGVKGVKIDFFGGDGRSVIQYYVDILKDAAQAGLLVNFHGATLPRGWSRTYPHLLTTEAVKGFEMITFSQRDADNEPNHATMLPYTRNAFDPMDFTPTNLYRIQSQVKRKTTSAFELATAVIYLSGIQHIAESPAGMSMVPAEVKQFLRELPNRWEDVRFIEGFPGKYIVIARKAGKKWFIAGINGENAARTIQLDLTPFNTKRADFIGDGKGQLEFNIENLKLNKLPQSIAMQPCGGFIMVLE